MDQNRSHDIFPTLGASAAVAIRQKSSSARNIYVDCRLDFSVKPDVSNPRRYNQIIVKNLHFTMLVMEYLHYNWEKKHCQFIKHHRCKLQLFSGCFSAIFEHFCTSAGFVCRCPICLCPTPAPALQGCAKEPAVCDTRTAAFPQLKHLATAFVCLPSSQDNGKPKGRQDTGLEPSFWGHLPHPTATAFPKLSSIPGFLPSPQNDRGGDEETER